MLVSDIAKGNRVFMATKDREVDVSLLAGTVNADPVTVGGTLLIGVDIDGTTTSVTVDADDWEWDSME